jgi:hypothetical protein
MPNDSKPKIYLTCFPAGPGWYPEDVIGYALAEDGTGLGSHLSSNVDFAKHDMGLTSDWKHAAYTQHYPEGFELVWLDDAENDPRWRAAYELNEAKYLAEHAAVPA